MPDDLHCCPKHQRNITLIVLHHLKIVLLPILQQSKEIKLRIYRVYNIPLIFFVQNACLRSRDLSLEVELYQDQTILHVNVRQS